MYRLIASDVAGYTNSHREYICDSVVDVGSLPTDVSKGDNNGYSDENAKCGVGSKAYVNDTVYMLTPNHQWVAAGSQSGGSGSGGSGIDADNIATLDEAKGFLGIS